LGEDLQESIVKVVPRKRCSKGFTSSKVLSQECEEGKGERGSKNELKLGPGVTSENEALRGTDFLKRIERAGHKLVFKACL